MYLKIVTASNHAAEIAQETEILLYVKHSCVSVTNNLDVLHAHWIH